MSVVPPNRTTLSKFVFCLVYCISCDEQRGAVITSFRMADGAPRSHQPLHKYRALIRGQYRVAASPQAPADHKITTVRCSWVIIARR